MLFFKYSLVALIAFVLGCKGSKSEPPKEVATTMLPEKAINVKTIKEENCPENGVCTWEIMAETNFVMKEDTIDALYPVFEKEEGFDTIKFLYDRPTKKGVSDGSYRELLYFRIPSNTTTLSLKDEALQDIGLVYGRLCFCRGAAGYFPVTKGSLSLSKTTNGYTIQVNFENGKVPQVINNLNGTTSIITR